MKDTAISKIADEIIEKKLTALDKLIEELIEPIEDLGNPEKIIDKKYEDWSPLDLQLLGQIYGNSNDSPLAKLIFEKSYEEVKRLEAE